MTHWPVRGDGRWPMFEVRRLSDITKDGSTLSDLLLHETVPVRLVGLSYQILDSTVEIEMDGKVVTCFGATALTGRVGVDGDTGSVVRLWATHDMPMSYVNFDLAVFRDSVRAIIERFPFYDSESPAERPDIIADELTSALTALDRHSFDEGSFWESFVDDVRNRDYTTEEIVAGYGNNVAL